MLTINILYQYRSYSVNSKIIMILKSMLCTLHNFTIVDYIQIIIISSSFFHFKLLLNFNVSWYIPVINLIYPPQLIHATTITPISWWLQPFCHQHAYFNMNLYCMHTYIYYMLSIIIYYTGTINTVTRSTGPFNLLWVSSAAVLHALIHITSYSTAYLYVLSVCNCIWIHDKIDVIT